MNERASPVKPTLGMTLAFKHTASPSLADIPACVIDVWPRFRSGDYLVTLEYPEPIKLGNELITHIEAFVSELYQPDERQSQTTHARRRTVPAQQRPAWLFGLLL